VIDAGWQQLIRHDVTRPWRRCGFTGSLVLFCCHSACLVIFFSAFFIQVLRPVDGAGVFADYNSSGYIWFAEEMF